MLATKLRNNKTYFLRLGLFGLNGLTATAFHYTTLCLLIDFMNFTPVFLANMCGAFVGISVSFLGNKYVVFANNSNETISQGLRFLKIYLILSLMHTAGLFLWSDVYGLSYHLGFVIITSIQLLFTYLGNKYWVFKS